MTSLKDTMAEVPSPSEMGKAEKFYEKIGDFVLTKDSVGEVKREDGSIGRVDCSYTIPRDIWETRTDTKFEFKEAGLVHLTDASVFYQKKLKESIYVNKNKAWSQTDIRNSFSISEPFATIPIEDTNNIKFIVYIRFIGDNDTLMIDWKYYIKDDADQQPTKLEIYTRMNESIYGLKRLLYREEEKYAEPADYAAPSPRVPVYVFFGHGNEEPRKFNVGKKYQDDDWNYRYRIPKGVTLVTVSECNTLVGSDFEKNKKSFEGIGEEKDISIFRDPIKNREAIRKLLGVSELNVYKAGDEYPYLLFYSLSSGHDEYTRDPITNEIDSRVTTYGKSGIYKLPITLQTFDTEWIQTLDGRYVHKTTGANAKFKGDQIYRTAKKNFTKDGGDLYAIGSEVKQKIFKDAVWPRPWMLEDEKLLHKTWRIDGIFDELGPGVYYWPICRSSSRYNPDAELVRAIRSESRSRHVTRGYGRKRKTYRRKTKKRLLSKR